MCVNFSQFLLKNDPPRADRRDNKEEKATFQGWSASRIWQKAFCRYCPSDPSTKIEEDENFCRVDKVTDRSQCKLMGSRLFVIGHMSGENSD